MSKRDTKSVGAVLRDDGPDAAAAVIVRLCLEQHRSLHPHDPRPDAEVMAGADVRVDVEGGTLSVSVAWPSP